MKKIEVRFWGVRGSTPAPSADNVKYGGNTPCVEIKAGPNLIICDAGTGIRPLGEKLAKTCKPINGNIFLSHLHWDHIGGLPFFKPIYSGKNQFRIFGPKIDGTTFRKALCQAISPPYFPVSLQKVPAKLIFKSVPDKVFRLNEVIVKPFSLSHPGGAFGWRFSFPNGKTLAYVSDNEPLKNPHNFIRWLKDVDMLIHDSQYTPQEYKKHIGWGHSPFTYPVKVAMAAGVKKLILSHFDPSHTDKQLVNMLSHAKKIIRSKKSKLKCDLAREKMKLTL